MAKVTRLKMCSSNARSSVSLPVKKNRLPSFFLFFPKGQNMPGQNLALYIDTVTSNMSCLLKAEWGIIRDKTRVGRWQGSAPCLTVLTFPNCNQRVMQEFWNFTFFPNHSDVPLWKVFPLLFILQNNYQLAALKISPHFVFLMCHHFSSVAILLLG